MSELPAVFDPEPARAFAGRKVLITGASGFVGGHFAGQALAAQVDAVAVGRQPAAHGLVFRNADLNDPVALMKSVRMVEPELIVHFASPGVTHGTAHFDEILRALVTGGEALLRAASELPVPPHLIQIGSCLEYSPQTRPICEDDPIVPAGSTYGAAKAAASALLGGYSEAMPITLLRPFNLHGAGDRSMRLGNWVVDKALAGEPVAISAGEQIRDFLHVDDFCRLIWQLAIEPPVSGGMRVLNVGSGEPRTVRSYVEAIANQLGTSGRQADLRFGSLAYRSGEPMLMVPDLSQLRAASDWQPQIAFDRAIADFVEWRLSRCG